MIWASTRNAPNTNGVASVEFPRGAVEQGIAPGKLLPGDAEDLRLKTDFASDLKPITHVQPSAKK